jgi:hypothetical protein
MKFQAVLTFSTSSHCVCMCVCVCVCVCVCLRKECAGCNFACTSNNFEVGEVFRLLFITLTGANEIGVNSQEAGLMRNIKVAF